MTQYNGLSVNLSNLDRADGATVFFIIEQARETILDFSQGTVKLL